MRATLFDFPIRHIVETNALHAASGSVRRAVTMIAHSYWIAGCEMPADDDASLSLMSTMANSQYTTIAEHVRKIWNELQPILAADYRERVDKHSKRAAQAEHMTNVRVAKRSRERMSTVSTLAVVPQREERIPDALKTRPIAALGNPPAQPRGRGPFRGKGFTD
jgi:hypothetical protein